MFVSDFEVDTAGGEGASDAGREEAEVGSFDVVCDAVEENLAGRDLMESVGDGLVIGMVDFIHVRSV